MNIKSSEKLNIAHLHWGFSPIIGGVESYLAIHLPTFAEREHKARLMTYSVRALKEMKS
jgi:hypothetical protein